MASILSYFKNKLSKTERYALEKEAQSDPFLKDAMDGFAKLTPEELEYDLAKIQAKLAANTPKIRKLVPWVQIAASITLFLTIGALSYFVIFPNLSPEKLAKQEQFEEIPEQPKIIEPAYPVDPATGDENKISSLSPISNENNPKNQDKGFTLIEDSKKNISPNQTQPSDIQETDTERSNEEDLMQKEQEILLYEQPLAVAEIVSAPENSSDQMFQNEKSEMAQVPTQEKQLFKMQKKQQPSQMIKAHEETMTLAPRSIPDSTKDNNIIVRYHSNASIHAIPETGLDKFETYILNNKSKRQGEAHPVKVEFVIDTRGRFISFVIENTDDIYANELIRLLKEGPKWIPAYTDSIPVNDSLSISVVF